MTQNDEPFYGEELPEDQGNNGHSAPQLISFEQHLINLQDIDAPLRTRDFRVLSGIHTDQIIHFRQVWQGLPPSRRRDIIQILITLAEDNTDLDFRETFLIMLDDPDATIRATAISGLGDDERPSTLRRLLNLVSDTSNEVCAAALVNLADFAYRAEVGELSPQVAQQLCDTLLDVTDDTARPIFVRRRAIEALGYFADVTEAQDAIRDAYDERNQDMRESAVIAMGRSMRDEWFTTIERELQNEKQPVLRFAAAQAVGELGEEGEPLLSKLLPLVDDEDAEVALAAVWALGQVGGPHGARILQRVAQSKDPPRRQAAQAALEELQLGRGDI